MSINYSPKIVTDGLRNLVDFSNIKSYSSGTNFTDLITRGAGVNCYLSQSSQNWLNNSLSSITINFVLTRLAENPSYAVKPIEKLINTTNCSFSVYFFGHNNNANPASEGNLVIYSNVGGSWTNVGQGYMTTLNVPVIYTVQYNSITGGQTWVNGSKYGVRIRSGGLGSINNSGILRISTPQGDTFSSICKLDFCSLYDRELSDNEIQQNFNAIRSRYNI